MIYTQFDSPALALLTCALCMCLARVPTASDISDTPSWCNLHCKCVRLQSTIFITGLHRMMCSSAQGVHGACTCCWTGFKIVVYCSAPWRRQGMSHKCQCTHRPHGARMQTCPTARTRYDTSPHSVSRCSVHRRHSCRDWSRARRNPEVWSMGPAWCACYKRLPRPVKALKPGADGCMLTSLGGGAPMPQLATHRRRNRGVTRTSWPPCLGYTRFRKKYLRSSPRGH